ncbi:MAG: tetratricopeptide repeat protein [Candidatus Cloacimonetes bacterium]|nr:tetratricopeptide repeat protein [Candidatus Cloacimonadota bacterium]
MDPFAIVTEPAEQIPIPAKSWENSPTLAWVLSFFVWGLGQLYNKEPRKAAIFFSGQLVSLLYFWDFLSRGVVYQVVVSHTGIFIYSFFIFCFSLFSLFIWLFNIFDAHRVASFLELVFNRTGVYDTSRELGWELTPASGEFERPFPWGSAFLYVLVVMVLVKYIVTGTKTGFESLVASIEKDPSNVVYRLQLADFWKKKGKVRRAVLELEEYTELYAYTLDAKQKEKLAKYLSAMKQGEFKKSFKVDKVLQEKEKVIDFAVLRKNSDWDTFELKASKYLETHSLPKDLEDILLYEYFQQESWDKARWLVAKAMRARPHDPDLIRSLATIENSIIEKKNLKKLQETRQQLLLTAIEKFKNQEYDIVQRLIEEYLGLGGKDKDAYILLVSAYQKQKKYRPGILVLNKAITNYPEDVDFQLFLAKFYYFLDDYTLALKRLDRVFKLSAKNLEANKLSGMIYRKQGYFKKAITYFEKVLVQEPKNEKIMFLLAYSYFKDDKYLNALRLYQRIYAQNPNYRGIKFYLGLAKEKVGDFETALRYFERVPSDSVFYNKAQSIIKSIHEKLSPKIEENVVQDEINDEPAVEAGVTVFGTEPSDVAEEPVINEKIDKLALLIKRAEQSYYDEDWALAIVSYQRVLEFEPQNQRALKQLGKVYLEREGDFSKAKSYLTLFQEMNEDDVWVNNALGVIAKSVSNNEEAAGYFEKALKQNPENLNANFNLALLYEDLNRIQKAKYYYQQVIKFHKQHQLAYNYLGDIFFNEGEFVKAEEYYRGLLKLAPDNTGVFFKMCLCLENQKLYSLALDELKVLLKNSEGEDLIVDEIEIAIARVKKKISKN